MARIRKPENETTDEAEIRRIKETIANKATRNEKVSFDRKLNNMATLLAKLQPIENQIIDLLAIKMPIIDEIQTLRNLMIKDCTHLITHLVEHEHYIICKFCNRKFAITKKN